MSRFFRNLFGTKTTTIKNKATRNRGARPNLEALEARVVPVLSAFGTAPATGMGTWLDGVVRVQSANDGYGSGSLLAGGRHILTAAHVLRNEQGFERATTRVTFDLPGGPPVEILVPRANYRIHAEFDRGTLRNDIAILVLPTFAPTKAPRYDIYTRGDEVGKNFLLAGYGNVGDGTTGNQPGTGGTRRWGENRFEEVDGRFFYDFDNPDTDLTAVGANESNGVPGDSGGPLFIGDRIAGISSGGNHEKDNFRFVTTTTPTRVSKYVHWIDERTGNYNPDVVLDMNTVQVYGQRLGNNGSYDVVEARLNGGRMELVVNGFVVVGQDLARVRSLKIIGSDDNDTITVDGRLGKQLKLIDGRGGQNTAVINDRAGAAPFYQVSSSSVLTSDWTIGLSGLQNLTLSTSHKAHTVDVVSLPTGTTTIHGGNGSETFTVGHQNGSLDQLGSRGTLSIIGGAGVDKLVLREGGAANSFTSRPYFTITDSKVTRSRTEFYWDGWSYYGFPYSLSTSYSGIEALTVDGASGGNQFAVQSTRAGVPVKLNGGNNGPDAFAIGDGTRSPRLIRGDLTIAGGSGQDTLSVIDTAPANFGYYYEGTSTYTLTSSQVRRSQTVKPRFDSPASQEVLEFNYSGIDDLTLRGGNKGGQFNVESMGAFTEVKIYGGQGRDTFKVNSLPTAIPAKLFGEGEDDTFQVGRSWGAMGAGIDIQGGAGRDSVLLNDSAADGIAEGWNANPWYEVWDNYVARYTPLEGHLWPDAITFNYAGVEDLRLTGAAHYGITYYMGAVSPLTSLTLQGGAGQDTLDYSNYSAGVRVDLPANVATDVAALYGFENATGGSGNDILVGDAARNVLKGGAGRDLLVGGGAVDGLLGGADEDILVAGGTDHDANPDALAAVMAEWGADLPYADRVGHLMNGGGLNGDVLLNRSTYVEDEGPNTLTGAGELELDLFYGSKARDAHDWDDAADEVFVDSDAALGDIRIDARDLSGAYLFLDYVTYATADAVTVNLTPGEHFFYTYGSDVVYFTVTAAGTVEYDPTLEGVLTGRGTSELGVNGAAVRIDAAGLDATYLFMDYTTYDADAAFTANLLPGSSHFFYTYGSDVVYFSVANHGTVGYDQALEGILTGRGTSELAVNGAAVRIDATALSASYLFMDYATYDADAAFTANLLPGSHFFYTYGSDVFYFNVAADGAVSYDAALAGFLEGEGTPALTVSGWPVEIDATALGESYSALDYDARDSSQPVAARLLPGQHFFYKEGSYYYFTIAADGTVDYDAAMDGVLSGRGTRTLTFLTV